MADGIRWVGRDVHAHESTIAIVDQGMGELSTSRVSGVRISGRRGACHWNDVVTLLSGGVVLMEEHDIYCRGPAAIPVRRRRPTCTW